jgi:hypothetical protein
MCGCERGNKRPILIRCRQLLYKLMICLLLEEDSAPCNLLLQLADYVVKVNGIIIAFRILLSVLNSGYNLFSDVTCFSYLPNS